MLKLNSKDSLKVWYPLLQCPKCFGTWTIEEEDVDYYRPPIRTNVQCPHCKDIVNATVEGW